MLPGADSNFSNTCGTRGMRPLQPRDMLMFERRKTPDVMIPRCRPVQRSSRNQHGLPLQNPRPLVTGAHFVRPF